MVGRNVRRLRIAAGLSQAQLAEKMGVDRAYVSGLELGQRNPTVVTLWHIAQALVLLSQKVAAFADENHVFGEIQFSACRGLRWVCQNLVTLHHGFRRTSRV